MFKSINYSRVVCEDCNVETVIEPGTAFSGLKCNCKDTKSKEISKPVQEEKDYVTMVTVIGRFDNGDYEVVNDNDSKDSWRIPKETFEGSFSERKIFAPECSSVLTFNHLEFKDKTLDELKDRYTVDELRVLAKEVGIKRYNNMKEETLIEKLIEKAG